MSRTKLFWFSCVSFALFLSVFYFGWLTPTRTGRSDRDHVVTTQPAVVHETTNTTEPKDQNPALAATQQETSNVPNVTGATSSLPGNELEPVETTENQPSLYTAVAALSLQSADLNSQNFPKKITVNLGDQQIETEFTGCYMRSKNLWITKLHLFEIASYVAGPIVRDNPDSFLADLLTDRVVKVCLLRFARTLTSTQIINAVQEEIDASFTDVDLVTHQASVDLFLKNFEAGAVPGDLVYMVWVPGGKLYCSFKQPEKVMKITDDFYLTRAIWRIWAGERAGDDRKLLFQLSKP